jgi:LPS-assembly protein
MRSRSLLFIAICILLLAAGGTAQQTNPVDRQVANPITDTPNINPIAAEKSIAAPRTNGSREGGDGEVVIYSDRQTVEGTDGSRVLVYIGNVDVRYGEYRLQADKITLIEAEDKMIAEGSVVFDHGDDQRITGARGVWNLKTKLGTFEDSTGFTNQTNDGTVIYFTADHVERTSLDTIVVKNGMFTACEEAVPKWSFTADEATIKIGDKVKLRNGKFRIKDVPVVPIPYVSIPIRERDRASGFLTPTVGFSAAKGMRISNAWYQTLGRSADATFRGDIYTGRGIGYGLDVRTRANSRSYFDFGFYAVKDRIFGPREDAEHPDQGGSIVYAEGMHYFTNGWTAAADIRLTSNLAFRQVFSDGVQQIISPIEVSQGFGSKTWDNYTLNLLARSQVISIPNVRINTKNLPSATFEKRPSRLPFLEPVYFSFRTALDGVSRKDKVDDVFDYRSRTGSDPIATPDFARRFDIYPELTLPITTKYFNFTATAAMRLTYYSNSFNDMRQVVGRDLLRKYGEFQFDVRPVALARNFYGEGDAFRFRHVIEPFVTYRFVKGIDNFRRIIRFDEVDTATDTNEVEFGVTNRIYTRRHNAAISSGLQRLINEREAIVNGNGTGRSARDVATDAGNLQAGEAPTPSGTAQPYELFSLTVRGKYFFDETFGGALIRGSRNQIEPITALTFYTFGGLPRRFSPLNIDATYRPERTIFVNSRMDVGVQGDGLRAMSATVGYDTPMLKLFQTFYYTRAVDLIPSLVEPASALERGAEAGLLPADGVSGAKKEAGTLRGAQWSPSVFLGNRDSGLYGGASVFFDFENRRAARLSPLISSLYTLGYAYDCCAIAVQYYTFNVGARNENRFVFSFRLNGIGSFGTQQFGQGLR